MSSSLSLRRQLAPQGVNAILCARTALAFFLGSIFLVAAPQLLAQSDSTSQDTQDVAEAARQARARKQQPTTTEHVYTNEDLHRSKILTQEDQTRAASNRKTQPLPAEKETIAPLDANSDPVHESLGDVARRYRNAKRNPQKSSPFHLPAQPELAAPKMIAPLTSPIPGNISSAPARPKAFLDSNGVPALKHPSLPLHRIDPFARRHTQPAPQIFSVTPRALPQPPAYSPVAPRSTSPIPSFSSTHVAQQIVVQQGDTLWTLSRQHLGRGTRWLELMAANSNILDPTRLVPGTVLLLPEKVSRHLHLTHENKITVQPGDSLSKIAHAAYGHSSVWPCIAQANALNNPNHLIPGQSLLLPASCTP